MAVPMIMLAMAWAEILVDYFHPSYTTEMEGFKTCLLETLQEQGWQVTTKNEQSR